MRDRDRVRRLVKAILAAALTGAGMLGLVRYVVLPLLAQKITDEEIGWLRQAFATHPVWCLLAIFAIAAALGLPALLVAVWTLRRRAES
jgi:predicted PurR-regulated permease PerM